MQREQETEQLGNFEHMEQRKKEVQEELKKNTKQLSVYKVSFVLLDKSVQI